MYDLGASETPGLAPLIAEYDANGNLVAKYYHDGGGLLAMVRGNQSYWYAYEAIGTTRQFTNSQTQVTDSYVFDAWGNLLTSSGTTTNPFRYVGAFGYYEDKDSGLMLLSVRYYNANFGRFLSLDPMRDGQNWYEYANNCPTLLVDPSGMRPIFGPIFGYIVIACIYACGNTLTIFLDFLVGGCRGGVICSFCCMLTGSLPEQYSREYVLPVYVRLWVLSVVLYAA